MEQTVNQGVTTDNRQDPAPAAPAAPEQQAQTEQPAAPAAPEEKTFTQSEVNAMIRNRAREELKKAEERADKLQAELDVLKADAAARDVRDKVAKETGVPAHLLTGSDEESCKKQAEAIKEYAAPKYPAVKDGGEVNINQKASTREQFAEWMEAQRK